MHDRLVQEVPALVKLHIGCGKRFLPDFVHIDLGDFPHVDFRQPAERLPMFADGSAELIYASHVLQYYDRQEVASVLAEWRRVLKPGGVLRLAVPDFPSLVDVYRQAGSLAPVLGPLYGRMTVEGEPGRVIYHKTTYDFDALSSVLTDCGFADVRRWEWRTTLHAAHDDFSQAYFPHMDKDHGLHVSLNVEATRP